ncbi:MAG: DUF4229 domain-containing protein [Actinomycetota bacterium]|nr:DUF4229 domain-containing protein [Actinomycetota bacterium]
MKPFVLYTLARLGLLVGALAVVVPVVALLGVPLTSGNLLWAALVSLVVSAVLSLTLLGGLREEFAASVTARAERIQERLDAARRKEDADDVD